MSEQGCPHSLAKVAKLFEYTKHLLVETRLRRISDCILHFSKKIFRFEAPLSKCYPKRNLHLPFCRVPLLYQLSK